MTRNLNRRRFVARVALAASGLALSACDRAGESPWFRRILETGEDINSAVQRFFLSPSSMAREYEESDISPTFRANGSTDPRDADYRRHAANRFEDWKLKVGGLVETPREFSLADLRGMSAREQITRHDCVEGWSWSASGRACNSRSFSTPFG